MKENSIEETLKQLKLILKIRKEQKEIIECAGGSCINCNPDIEALTNSIDILSDYKRVLKENEELKAKYDKDTHTLQNQLDIANADRVGKDKIIDLMANFMNKRSWKEHQVKDDICFCCKIEYSSEECVKCIKQYFKKKVGN